MVLHSMMHRTRTFERDLSVTIDRIWDISGDAEYATIGPLESNSVMQTNDLVEVRGTVEHTTSGEAYTGSIALRWNGLFQTSNWVGGQTVLVENGVFTTTFSVPETSGTIFDAELQIWDPIESERFLTTAFPNVIIDGDEPVLLTANVDQPHDLI